jgi:hypothetical protein
MRVNTAIHRANRLTPLDQTLPFTCQLLGERLADLLDRSWTGNLTENLQVPAECERFAVFLQREIDAGEIVDPYLEDVLERLGIPLLRDRGTGGKQGERGEERDRAHGSSSEGMVLRDLEV